MQCNVMCSLVMLNYKDTARVVEPKAHTGGFSGRDTVQPTAS